MNKFLENLKREAEENPVLAMVVSTALLTAVSKLIKAHGEAAGSRAYARQVNWKIKNAKK